MTPRFSRLPILAAVLTLAFASLATITLAQNESVTTQPATSRSEEIVVLSDTFDDPAVGVIPPYSGATRDMRAEYDSGVYDIDALADDFTGTHAIPFGDTYADVTVAVDAILSGGTIDLPGRYIFLECRIGESGGGYRMEFRPQISAVILRRLDTQSGTRIASGEFNDGAATTAGVRLELSCTGDTISGKINGQQVASAADTAYTSGGLQLGGGVYTVSSGRVSVDFDNLAVSIPTSAVPTPTPAPVVDRSALMAPVNQLRSQATARPPVFGPAVGGIIQVVGGSLDARYSGVSLADFVARITFENPEGTASGRWDVGLGFRQGPSGKHWRVIIRSDGTWSLAIAAEFPRATGVIESFDFEPGGSNTVELLVSGPVGYLLVNDSYTAMIDLSAWQEAGDVWAGSGFFLDYATAGLTTPYRDFAVWSIGQPPAQQEATTNGVAETPVAGNEDTATVNGTPIAVLPDNAVSEEGEPALESVRSQTEATDPEFGPAAGEVTQAIGSIDIESAGVFAENFYTTVRFSNPSSPNDADHSWDVVIGFWHTGGDDQVRVVVSSDGTWSVAEGTARPTVTGNATSIALGPARGNEIELAVVDGTGYLAINGQFAGSFDVPGTPRPGDIWIASGTFPENVQQGIATPFSGWSVWSLD